MNDQEKLMVESCMIDQEGTIPKQMYQIRFDELFETRAAAEKALRNLLKHFKKS